MKIAVTGASGHIGVNLCRLLVNKGIQVRALIHENRLGIDDLELETVSGDLLDLPSLKTLVDGVDIVFHLAAVISIQGKKDKEILSLNVEGTRNLLKAASEASVKRFIHFSSIHALSQEPYAKVLDETRPIAINDWMVYSRSKALAEKEVLRFCDSGLDAVILNPTAVIGPFDYRPSLLGRALILMASGRLPFIVPGGYNWVDVRDVAQAAFSSIKNARRGERYLLSGHWSDLKALSRIVSNCSGRKPPWISCPRWLAKIGLPFIQSYCFFNRTEPLYTYDSINTLKRAHQNISHQKAAQELGFTPRPLEESLKDTLEWFRENGYLTG
ncbi:MAG: NAD-dependent epimerase/dehydratase family protein [Candidatus Aminicenantes bacterium]|nr:NAD-dependent epimerase/dehydratase family protein [Candidatus Aminicenantes bacterium]